MTPRLYLVTDRHVAQRPLAEVIAAALAALPPGAAWVQLREKDLDGGPLLALARRLVPIVRARGARLLVNDRVDVALAAGADGVHLPERGLAIADVRRVAPALAVAVSVHSAAAAAAARAASADAVVYGPVWPTRGKPAGCGLDRFPAGAIAIGGVDGPARARQARRAGAAGIACIRAVMAAADPGAAARALYEALV
ncbi:MAG: thiamine phosphate synthase [Deltaproteobacteria bacterium]|nr:MAG: thiamine phosphate synthase [Deltaproteobacteria bacterium]